MMGSRNSGLLASMLLLAAGPGHAPRRQRHDPTAAERRIILQRRRHARHHRTQAKHRCKARRQVAKHSRRINWLARARRHGK